MKSVIISLFFFVMILNHGPVVAEYYQYQDKNGNLRFTDDISRVPETQRGSTKQHESVKNPDGHRKATGKTGSGGMRNNAGPATGSWDVDLSNTAESLDQENRRLQEMFRSLQKRRKALEQEAAKNMNTAEKAAHEEKVRKINADIEKYHKQRDAYLKKQKQFEARLHPRENSAKQSME